MGDQRQLETEALRRLLAAPPASSPPPLMGPPVPADDLPAWKKTAQSVFEGGMDTLMGAIGFPAKETTANLVGQLLAAGAPLAATKSLLGKLIKPGIKAFHGSPHDFDQFSLGKIGTGEGAQAYGHGLYFAENQGVAKDYQKKLSGLLPEGWAQKYPDSSRGYIRGVVGDVADGKLTPEQAAKHVYNANSGMREYPQAQLAAEIAEGAKSVKGRMYEVNIHADPDDFLDWDAPLSQQSEKVRQTPIVRDLQAAEHFGYTSDEWRAIPAERRQALMDKVPLDARSTSKGSNVYSTLTQEHGGQGVVSQQMKEAGIPGIKYLDGASRSAGQGSRNYVVFDDKLISIVKKYGIAGAVSAGLLSQAQAQQMKEQGYQ